ncbi:S8 family serine peptidase [Neobacillus sp.]|uniref:S8 family serine peptidase n=1 Tax=Neobacillus sp. TaxID=2675273 RepID=UPI0028977AE8|nr:S8 family serine peptidase [Neobacillus sp.]
MKRRFWKKISSLLSILLVFSLLAPYASANTGLKGVKQTLSNESIMQLKAAVAQQEDLLQQGPSLHHDLQGVTGAKEVNVIVHLSEDSVALAEGKKKLTNQTLTAAEKVKVKNSVNAQQTQVKKTLQAKKVKIKEKFSYDTVLNGIAMSIKADDLDKLLKTPGVTLVEPDLMMHALENPSKEGKADAAMNTSASHLGIEKLWEKGFEGQKIKVGVLDTGIDYDHPDLVDAYKGGKNYITHGSEYARGRAANDPYETTPLDRAPATPEFNSKGSAFYTSHGTHVAGTIAAAGKNEYGIKGLAPKVDLYAYRVLGAYGSGASSGIIKGIDDAVKDKMDVINLSLGGDSNSAIEADSIAINNAMIAGTVAVVATGNSGPGRGTIGNPSTAALGIAVGNSTNPEKMYTANVKIDAAAYAKEASLNLMAITFGKNLEEQVKGEFDVVAIPGVGKPADFTGIDVKGKVALIARGEIAFVDKISAAKAAGAVAAIIHNSQAGTNSPGPSNVFLSDSFEFIPTIDMSYTEGTALRAALGTTSGKVSFSGIVSTAIEGDEVNDSSSRGPTNPEFDIKPDVTAPGTNIMSTIPEYKKDFPEAKYDAAYDRKTGTSMAAPHIAAIAALIRQANPDWTPFDVKVALSNTAKILDTKKYDVFAQGPGRVQPYKAAFPDVLAYGLDKDLFDNKEVEHEKGTITFGKLPQVKDGNVSVTRQIRVKDLAGKGGDYSVRVQTTKAFGDAKVTVDKPMFTLNGSQMLEVTLTASKAAPKPGDELLGYIYITSGENEISLPFAADFNGEPPTAIEYMNLSETDLSFNGDGVKDEALLTFKITGDLKENSIELWDINNPKGGEYGDGYIGYLHAANSLKAGAYQLPIKGTYKPWSPGTATATIPDGLYTIDLSGKTASGNPAVVGDFAGPIVVKTTSAKVAASYADGKVTGKVTDKYLDYNQKLAEYGLDYDINTKLFVSYELSKNGEKSTNKASLKKDGSFTIETAQLNEKTDYVKMFVNDAAGNKMEQMIFGKDVNAPIVVGLLDPVPSQPVSPDHPYVKTFGFDNIAISPNKDGRMDKTNYQYEFKEAPTSAVYVNVFDAANPKSGKNGNGIIGDILFDYNKLQKGSGTFDGIYTNGSDFKKGPLKDGVYGFDVSSYATGFKKMEARVGPIFVKSTPTKINVQGAELETKETVLTGSIDDQFIGFGLIVKDTFKTEYDLNKYVKLTAFVFDAGGNETTNHVVLGQDGTFSASLSGLSEGKNRVVVIAQDIAGNTSQSAVFFNVKETPKDVVTVSVDREELSLLVGDTGHFKVTETTTKPDGTTTKKDVTADATYTSANESIAKVKNGVVTAVGAGETTVTVVYGDFSANVKVTVDHKTVKELKVNTASLDLIEGGTAQLTLKSVEAKGDKVTETDVTKEATYSGFNSKVVSVKDGLVTAIAPGTTEITVEHGENKATVKVTVDHKTVKELKVNTASLDLIEGGTAQLTLKSVEAKGDKVTETDVTKEATYSGFNSKVVSVKDGLVTAIAPGTTEITVAHGGNKATVKVTVDHKTITELKVNKNSLKLAKGKTSLLSVESVATKGDKVTKTDVTKKATYSGFNSKVVSVRDGLVTAVAPGTTEITVTFGDQTEKVTVVVFETGWVSENGNWYYLNSNGEKSTGWVKDGVTWYYLSTNGKMQTGWLKDGSKWYYLNKNGAMATGWAHDGKAWYYLQSNGAMGTGWKYIGQAWYFLNNTGSMATGWVFTGGKWYYLYSNGKMASKTTVNGYKLGADGAWVR